MQEKYCKKCNKLFEQNDYVPHYKLHGEPRWFPECRSCLNARVREWRKKNPDKAKGQRQRAYARNATPEWQVERGLRRMLRQVGITRDQYEQQLTFQNFVCAICKKPEPSKRISRLVIDHDHETGQFRGLLCSNCNKGLGYLEDVIQNPELLTVLINYLHASRPIA